MGVSQSNFNEKIKGVESCECGKRPFPHPSSPKPLEIQAQRLGMSVGINYAEPFCIVRALAKI